MEIGAIEAQSMLPALLGRAALGETFIIVDQGRRLAQLLPVEHPAVEENELDMVVERMLKRRDEFGPPLGRKWTIKEMIEDGRRY